MKKIKLIAVLMFLCCFSMYSQWNTNGSNIYYNGGNIGVGTASPTARMDILTSATSNHLLFRSHQDNGRFEIGFAPDNNGHYAPYAKAGDVIVRKQGMIDGHLGLLFHMRLTNGDGKSYIKFGDDKNGGWFTIFDNKKVGILGNVGIGTDAPTQALDVRGMIRSQTSYGYIQFGPTNAEYSQISTDRPYFYFNQPVRVHSMLGSINNLHLQTVGITRLTILRSNGNVGIGVTNPQYKLEVNGSIHAKEVRVDLNGWADYVFADDYNLQSLNEVKAHIQEKKHLPGIPSEAEVKENGIGIGDMQVKLLQKIEEMTLYMIQQQETIDMLKDEVKELKKTK